MLKCTENFKIGREISRELRPAKLSNLHVFPSARLCCSGQFAFKVTFTCIFSVFLLYSRLTGGGRKAPRYQVF